MEYKIKIADMLLHKHVSAYELARRINRSKPYVNSLKLQNRGSLKTLTDVCLALNYSHVEIAKIIINELELDVNCKELKHNG